MQQYGRGDWKRQTKKSRHEIDRPENWETKKGGTRKADLSWVARIHDTWTKSTAGKHSNRRPLFSKQTELTDAGPNPRLNLYVVAVDI